MIMPGDYSEELVEPSEQVYRAAAEAYFQARPAVPEITIEVLMWSERLRAAVDAAFAAGQRAILDALSSSGRLVPEGSEVWEEWRVTGDPGQGYPPYDFTWRDGNPERAARAFVGLWADRSPWPDGPHLAHHTVITTPWTPSEPTQEQDRTEENG